MRRWLPAFLVAVLACVPILLAHSNSPSLLKDTDTQALIHALHERNSPLSWFAGDWPLGNHFYRPFPTLTFELNEALAPGNPDGFGWVNAWLCVSCTLLLFWFLREFTNSPWIAAAGSAIFSIWQLDLGSWLSNIVQWIWIPVALIGLFRHRLRFFPVLSALLVFSFLLSQLAGQASLQFRMIAWLPGRTASVMALFCLLAMAAYARYERQTAGRMKLPPATALDPNVPMKVDTTAEPGKRTWLWVALSILATMAALASYEQAVMLPAIILAIAVGFKLMRRRPHRAIHAAFWLALVGYLVLRHAVVPSTVSGYQAQQFRHGPGVVQAVFDYVLPAYNLLEPLVATLATGLSCLFIGLFWDSLWGIAANLWGLKTIFSSRQWQMALTAFVMSFLAYLPMAWLKPFDHYHYWPMAIRSLFVVLLGANAAQAILIAISPPALQAPRRQNPAPGSLLHP